MSLLLGPLWFATVASTATMAPKPQGSYYGVFRELPVTDITPEGWLAQFRERQRDGLGAHYELSGYPFDTCLRAGKIPGTPKKDGTYDTKPANWDRYEQTARKRSANRY